MRKRIVPPHKHCFVCGKVIPENKRYCSSACERALRMEERKSRRAIRFMYLAFSCFLILLALLLFTGGK